MNLQKYTSIAIVILTSVAVYLNTLSNEFVFDDLSLILRNRWITDIRNIPDIFASSFWSFEESPRPSNYYRPTMHLIYMAEYHIFGLEPWGWHLVNIIFHTLNSIMVFLMVSSLFPPYFVLFPFIASLLFAIHPIHTEPVAWVAGITELSFTFFYLLSFYFYIHSKVRSFYLLSLVSFLLAVFSKETALTLPLLIIVYDYLRKGKNFIKNWNQYLLYIITAIAYIVIRTYVLGGVIAEKYISLPVSTYQLLITVPSIVIQYIGKLLLPIKLNALYTSYAATSIVEPKVFISIFLLLVIGVVVFLLRKNQIVLICFAWIFISLFPALYLPGLSGATFAERYLYLPSIGFVILFSYIIQHAWCAFKVSKSRKALLISALLLLVGFYSTVTINRNLVWHDEYTLWSDTVKKSPNSALAQYNLGNTYYDKGFLDEAISSYQKALEFFKGPLKIRDVYNNLGSAYAKKGLLDEAIRSYEEALRIDPQDRIVLHNLEIVRRKIQSGTKRQEIVD